MLARLGSYLAPRPSLKNEAVQNARMAYDAATRGRRSQGWRVVSTDANSELLGAASRLRDVARDMVRNVPLAARAKKVIAHNTIVSGIIPTISANDEKLKAKLESLLKEHFDTTACDAFGRHDLYGLQNLVMATVVESGEALIRYRPRLASDGLPLPFQLQVMEPDYIDSSISGPQPNGNYAVQGIEFNGFGKIVAYHLFPEHPGSMATFSLPVSKPVPAANIAHVYYTERPGQARGVTWFAPVILRMRDRADFSDAHLMRQKIAACFAAFIRSTEGSDGIDATSADPYPVESLEPGMIERLNDGEDVTFGNPPQVGDYGDYIKAQDREIAAALGISYEALTGDLSNVNFSSGRMGWLEMQRNIDAWRNFMLLPQMLHPIGNSFLASASVVLGRAVDAQVAWTPPRREMINPTEEVKASRDAIRTGLSSRSNEQRKLGFDPVDLDSEIEADNKRADAKGLIFDSDPRKVTSVGNPTTGMQPNQ